MKEILKHLKVEDKNYPICFNLNVMEKIQDEYGSIEKWGELTDDKSSEINIKALKFGVLEMMNEAIDIENEKQDEKMDFLNEKQVGRIITVIGLEKLTENVQKTVVESTNSEENSKNV